MHAHQHVHIYDTHNIQNMPTSNDSLVIIIYSLLEFYAWIVFRKVDFF